MHDRAFMGPVAFGWRENRAAHGNITRTEECRRGCGAMRRVNINNLHEEIGSTFAEIDDVDRRIADLQRALQASRRLDEVERSAWSAGRAGHSRLSVEGATPVDVKIELYRGDDAHVLLSLDGDARSCAVADIAAAADSPRLDEAQRTVWALIARRVRRMLAHARGQAAR